MPAETIAVVDCGQTRVNWLDPRDLSAPQLANGIPQTGHRGGANVLMADGSAVFLQDAISPSLLKSLLTVENDLPAGATFP